MDIIGTWRLIRAEAYDSERTLVGEPYGPVPMGRIVFTQTGRMMAVICDGRPRMPEGETRNYASYCGNFRVEGDRLITTVDAAAIVERIGGQQVRVLRFDGDDLVLVSPRRPTGEQRELTWRHDGPA